MVELAGAGQPGTVEEVRRALASQGQGTWIRTVPKDDELTVRFLTEPHQWFSYREHFRQDVKFFPCVERNCPGCEDPDEGIRRRSRRFLASALDVEQGVVVPLKLPLDLANRLFARYERYDTLTDRDYVLMRAGQGLNTTYDLDTLEPKPVDTSRYDLVDAKALLIQQYEDAFGSTTDPPSKDPEVPSESSGSTAKGDSGDVLTEDTMLNLDHAELFDLATKLGITLTQGEEATTQDVVDEIFANYQGS